MGLGEVLFRMYHIIGVGIFFYLFVKNLLMVFHMHVSLVGIGIGGGRL